MIMLLTVFLMFWQVVFCGIMYCGLDDVINLD
jgi:hypothetical protein